MRVPPEQDTQLGRSHQEHAGYSHLVRTQRMQEARPQLLRATTDMGPRNPSPARSSTTAAASKDEEHWELRHGWEEEYNSEEYLNILNAVSTCLVYQSPTNLPVILHVLHGEAT